MMPNNRIDVYSGILLLATGIYFFFASIGYGFGNLRQIGPGIYPAALAGITFFLGIVLIFSSFYGEVFSGTAEWRPLLATAIGIAVFGLLIEPFGVVPAIFALVITSSRGDPTSKLIPALMIALVMSVCTWLIFRVGIGLSMPAFRNPF